MLQKILENFIQHCIIEFAVLLPCNRSTSVTIIFVFKTMLAACTLTPSDGKVTRKFEFK